MDVHVPVSAAGELDSMLVYDRSELEEYLAAVEAECEGLRSAIDAAEARRDELREARSQSATARLGEVMLEAQAGLTAEWDACHRFSAEIDETTEALAMRIIAEARGLSEALRSIGTEARARGRDCAHEVGEPWWDDILDLTTAGQDERAQIV